MKTGKHKFSGLQTTQLWSRATLSQFTLVELLIVIAIISMLMAMLLPSLKKAKDMSKRIACTGNLRQNGIAVTNYTIDFNGWTPMPPGHKIQCPFEAPVHPIGFTYYMTEYLGVKIRAFSLNSNYGEFVNPDNAACCPARYGACTWTDFYGNDAWNKTASSYVYPGFAWQEFSNGSIISGYIRLEKLASVSTVNGTQHKKFLMADKCIYPGYFNDAQNNHLSGGNFLFGDGHVEWFSYSNGVRMLSGSWWIGGNIGQFFPFYTLIPDRCQSNVLSGFKIDASTFAWYGYTLDRDFH